MEKEINKADVISEDAEATFSACESDVDQNQCTLSVTLDMEHPFTDLLPLKDVGKIFVFRGSKDILLDMAIQLTLEYAETLYPVTIYYREPVSFSIHSTPKPSKIEQFRERYSGLSPLSIFNDGIAEAGLRVLGRIDRENVDHYFIAFLESENLLLVGSYLEELRLQANLHGERISVIVLVPDASWPGHADLKGVSEYFFDVVKNEDDIVLETLKYGGNPFPKNPVKFYTDRSDMFHPYKRKNNRSLPGLWV